MKFIGHIIQFSMRKNQLINYNLDEYKTPTISDNNLNFLISNVLN